MKRIKKQHAALLVIAGAHYPWHEHQQRRRPMKRIKKQHAVLLVIAGHITLGTNTNNGGKRH